LLRYTDSHFKVQYSRQVTRERKLLNDWTIGIVSIVAALGVASGIAWFGSMNGAMYAGWPVFALCGVFAYVVQWLVFVHAWAAKTEIYFDLTGSVTYIVMVVAAVLLAGASDLRSLALVTLIVIWALRLGPFLFRRIKRAGDDRRFRKLKHSFPMFLMTWTLQGTWVFVTASCALAAITAQSSVPVDATFGLGVLLWVCGFGIEVIADNQKTAFRVDPDNAANFISTGLWAWSRHPNYFGEIVLWLGIAVMSYPVLVGGQLFTLISPIFVVILLTFISGVRLLEARANRLWGEDPDYQQYRRTTPTLMLWPPKNAA
jgi:steroid 5-alpha reductase family enzyme